MPRRTSPSLIAMLPTTTMTNSTSSDRRISYSQYSMWAGCPKRWKLNYIDELKKRDNTIHTIFGTAMHEAIQGWLSVLYSDKVRAKSYDLEGYFKDHLMRLFKENISQDDTGESVYLCDMDTLKQFYRDGCAILDHVRTYQKEFFPTMGYKLIGCEIPLEVPVANGIVFVGFIDIVIAHPRTNKIFIYDLKTSKRGWYYEKNDPMKLAQILLYKNFYSELFEVPIDNITPEFIILKREVDENSKWGAKRISKFEPANGKPSMKNAVQGFNNFISSTFDENGHVQLSTLVATPSKKACQWCEFKNRTDLCPESYG